MKIVSIADANKRYMKFKQNYKAIECMNSKRFTI